MPALPLNFDPYNPIPNNPFYSPPSSYLQGPFGPLVLGSGLSISTDGIISATGGGGSGGTVTSVAAGAGLAGGVITTSGTLSLAASGAVAGSYAYPALSVDVYGRITSISSGSPVTGISANLPIVLTGSTTSPTVSIQQASTSQVGATQLNNSTSSNLTNQALTAAAGKSLQDQINAISQNSNGLILAGTLNATTGNVITATTAGNAAGFTAGAPVPAAAPAINDYYLIVTTGAASYTPTGGTPILNVIVGDYILVASGVWTILRVGPVAGAYATTTTAGIVELATPSEAITGTDPNLVLTPFTATAAFVTRNTFTAKGQILAATGSSTYSALPLGVDGQVLTADSSATNGVKWAAGGGGGGSTVNITFQAPLSSSTNPYTGGSTLVDIADASTASCGVVQLADNSATSAGTSTTLALTPAGAASVYFPYCDYTAKGQIAVATGSNTYAIVGVGTNGQVLKACSTCTSGVFWDSAAGTPATPTALGTMYGIGLPDAGANFAVGSSALQSVTTGTGNTAVGIGSLPQLTTGSQNVSMGICSLFAATSANCNVALGTGAAINLTTGNCNVAIGNAICLPGGATASCELALGFANGCCWLTGDSGKNIRPGAGIRDCAGNLGTAGQVLCSTGTAIQWAAPGASGYCSAQIAPGSCVVYCTLQFWFPSTGSKSVQIATSSGTVAIDYVTTNFVGGIGVGVFCSAPTCIVTTTPLYFSPSSFDRNGLQTANMNVYNAGTTGAEGDYCWSAFYSGVGPSFINFCVQKYR